MQWCGDVCMMSVCGGWGWGWTEPLDRKKERGKERLRLARELRKPEGVL